MFQKKRTILCFAIFLFLVSCKPTGGDNSEVKSVAPTSNSLEWYSRGTPSEIFAYQKSKVKLWTANMIYGEPAAPEPPVVAVKSFWSLSKYYMSWRYKVNLKQFEAIVAGKTPDFSKSTGITAKISDHFAMDAGGLHFSSSKGIREALRKVKAAGDAATDVLVNAAEAAKYKADTSWWDRLKNPVTPLTAAEKKMQTAINVSQAQAIKDKSPYYNSNSKTFDFKVAYTNFKKAEKMSLSTNVEATVDRGSGKITAWVGGKILGKSINQGPHFLEAWVKAGVDEAVVMATANKSVSAFHPAALPLGKGLLAGVTFFGQNSTLTPVSGVLKNLIPAIPKIPPARFPVFAFPGGTIVVSFMLNPVINIMVDINVRKAGMVTLTLIPMVGMTFTAKVGVELAVVGIGVKGDLTVFQYKVPMSLSIGGSKTNGLYYAGTLIAGPILSMFGGSVLSLYAELALPSPFNYVVWAASAIAKAVTGFSLWSELGLSSEHLSMGYVLWAPEGMLTLYEGAGEEGPSYIPALSGMNCLQLQKHVDAHKREAKLQPVPPPLTDPIFAKVDDNINKMIAKLQTAIDKECSGKAGGAAPRL